MPFTNGRMSTERRLRFAIDVTITLFSGDILAVASPLRGSLFVSWLTQPLKPLVRYPAYLLIDRSYQVAERLLGASPILQILAYIVRKHRMVSA